MIQSALCDLCGIEIGVGPYIICSNSPMAPVFNVWNLWKCGRIVTAMNDTPAYQKPFGWNWHWSLWSEKYRKILPSNNHNSNATRFHNWIYTEIHDIVHISLMCSGWSFYLRRYNICGVCVCMGLLSRSRWLEKHSQVHLNHMNLFHSSTVRSCEKFQCFCGQWVWSNTHRSRTLRRAGRKNGRGLYLWTLLYIFASSSIGCKAICCREKKLRMK